MNPHFSAAFHPASGLPYSPSAEALRDLDDGRIADMDPNGTAMQVLSSLSTQQLPPDVAVELVRTTNDTSPATPHEHRRRAPKAPMTGTSPTTAIGRHGDHLDAWLAAVEADTLFPLHRFAAGLRRDYDAVRAGPTLDLLGTRRRYRQQDQMIKRQMFDGANFDPRAYPRPGPPRPITARGDDQSRHRSRSVGKA